MWNKFLYNEHENVDLAIPLWNSVYILIIGIGSLGIFAYIFHLISYDLRSYAPDPTYKSLVPIFTSLVGGSKALYTNP